MKLFDCDDLGNKDKCVGCNINGDDGFTFTQSVMLKSFRNDSSLPKRVPNTTLMSGKTLTKSTEEDIEPPEEMTYFCKEVGKLIYMMIWSRPEIYNWVR